MAVDTCLCANDYQLGSLKPLIPTARMVRGNLAVAQAAGLMTSGSGARIIIMSRLNRLARRAGSLAGARPSVTSACCGCGIDKTKGVDARRRTIMESAHVRLSRCRL